MPDLREFLGRRRADRLGCAARLLQFRERRLDLGMATAQRIIGRIRNLWLVLAVIELVVVGDLSVEPGPASRRRRPARSRFAKSPRPPPPATSPRRRR